MSLAAPRRAHRRPSAGAPPRSVARVRRSVGAAGDLLEGAAEAPAPIRVAVGRAGQVRLLALADHVLELHQHQPGARAGEIAQDRLAEFGGVVRLADLGQETIDAVARRSSPSPTARRAADGGRGARPSIRPLRPPGPGRARGAGARRCRGRARTLRGSRGRGSRPKRRRAPGIRAAAQTAVGMPLKGHDPIGQHLGGVHRLAKARRDGAEILADDGARMAGALERDEAQQIVETAAP